MPDLKVILKNYLRVILILIITFCKCLGTDTDHSNLKDNSHNLNNDGNKAAGPKVYEVNQASKNVSANENDVKDVIPILSNKVNSTTATTMMEGFTIFACLSIAVVLYFTIKSIRLRRRRSRVRKYGLLTTRDDVVEMTPLGEEEEDEDSTVFDINDHPQP